MYSTTWLFIYNKGGCLVSSFSAAHARLHSAKIYIVVVMYYKNVPVLSAAYNDFLLECRPPNKVIVVCIL